MSISKTFLDKSTPGPAGPITAWDLDFGDGSPHGSGPGPWTNAYASANTYTVVLTITGTSPDGTSMASRPVVVNNPGALTALFRFSVSGLVVTFTDESTPGPSGPITAWDWNWGDSTTHGTTQNPTHTYASPGTYTVTLTVTGTSPDGTANNPQSVTVSSGGLNLGSLKFSDEFDGPAGAKPDSTKWIVHTGKGGLGLGYWNGLNNMELDGSSNLVVTAVKQSNGNWNSGFLSGKSGYSGQRYLETRAKVAAGAGTWNAPLWEDEFPWGAKGTENDVIEQLGREPAIYHTTLHNWTASPNKAVGNANNTGATLSSAFHTYGAAVYSDHIDFYFDGSRVFTATASAVGLPNNLTSFLVAPQIQLNMGGWGGTVGVPGPVSMLVDYVRVYVLL